MDNIVLHPTYAERLWLMTVDRGIGVLYEDAPPLLVVQCLRAGWHEARALGRGRKAPDARPDNHAMLPCTMTRQLLHPRQRNRR